MRIFDSTVWVSRKVLKDDGQGISSSSFLESLPILTVPYIPYNLFNIKCTAVITRSILWDIKINVKYICRIVKKSDLLFHCKEVHSDPMQFSVSAPAIWLDPSPVARNKYRENVTLFPILILHCERHTVESRTAFIFNQLVNKHCSFLLHKPESSASKQRKINIVNTQNSRLKKKVTGT